MTSAKAKNQGKLANWNGNYSDRRGRCYAFAPGQREELAKHSIRFHMSEFEGEDAEEDEKRNLRCSVNFQKSGDETEGDLVWTDALTAAVEEVASLIRPQVDEKYLPFLDNLVALQPNQHNGTVGQLTFMTTTCFSLAA